MLTRLIFLSLTFLIGIAVNSYVVAAEFSDVKASHPYFDAINYFSSSGIIKGYADGSFGMQKKINRAEFLSLLMKANGITGKGQYCFKDIKKEWFSGAVCEAKRRGFVKGYDGGFFKPQDEISFAEATAIIAKIFNLQLDQKFTEPWYRPYIEALEDKKAIPLSILSFNEKLNRGQVAEMLWRLITTTLDKESTTYARLARRFQLLRKEQITLPAFFALAARRPELEKDRDFLGEIAAKAVIEMNDLHLIEYGVTVSFDMELAAEIDGLVNVYRRDSPRVSSNQADLIIYKNTVILAPRFSDKIFFLGMDPQTATFFPLYDETRHNELESPSTFLSSGEMRNGLFYLKDKYAFYYYDFERETLAGILEVDPSTVELFSYSRDGEDIPLIRDAKKVYVFDEVNGLEVLSQSRQAFSVQSFTCSLRGERFFETYVVKYTGRCSFAKDGSRA